MADLVTEELQEEEAGAEEGKEGGMGAGGLETAGTKKDEDVVVVDAAACCTVGGVDLTKEQLAELKDIFSRFDRDQDGSITELELGSLLRSLGLKPAGHQLEALLQRADTNSNGYIEFSEFVALIGPEMVTTVPYNDKELLAVFRAFDRDGNGFITAAELVHSMARLGHSLTVRELSDMIREADTDGDGRISFQEFATAMSSASSLDVVL
jgi:calcium-binding protein CML